MLVLRGRGTVLEYSVHVAEVSGITLLQVYRGQHVPSVGIVIITKGTERAEETKQPTGRAGVKSGFRQGPTPGCRRAGSAGERPRLRLEQPCVSLLIAGVAPGLARVHTEHRAHLPGKAVPGVCAGSAGPADSSGRCLRAGRVGELL